MLHSKVAMLSSAQAARTRLMACISSDVSITTMGVEELMSTFRRSSPSGMGSRFRITSATWRKVRLTGREMLPYNKEFGPTRISFTTHEGNESAMANHASALKRVRQTERRTARNRANTSSLRTQLRDLRESIEKGDKAAAEQMYRKTVSALDKAIQKGTLHENTASRYKSRLGKRVSAIK